MFDKIEMRTHVEQRFVRELNEFLYFVNQYHDFTTFDLILPNVAKAAQILRSAEQQEGVRTARIDLIEEHIELRDILIEQVARRLTRP
jgi:Asp-tRNA(Asn)/Glu-tRNA(Gln) amidotransferase C subunit